MRSRREITLEDRVQWARDDAMQPVANMNRAERRAARGRVKVAEAKAKAVEAENQVLREALDDLQR
jgi:hypothetical protein